MGNFSALLDELHAFSVIRDRDEPRWRDGAMSRVKQRDMAKAMPPAAAPAPNPPKPKIGDLLKALNDLGVQRQKVQADIKKKRDKIAAEQKAREDAVIAARNSARSAVSNVLAKALELNRLGKLTAPEVARIEIAANESLRRIG